METRAQLCLRIRALVEELGPQVHKNFQDMRVIPLDAINKDSLNLKKSGLTTWTASGDCDLETPLLTGDEV